MEKPSSEKMSPEELEAEWLKNKLNYDAGEAADKIYYSGREHSTGGKRGTVQDPDNLLKKAEEEAPKPLGPNQGGEHRIER
jgi:hypothetical protein